MRDFVRRFPPALATLILSALVHCGGAAEQMPRTDGPPRTNGVIAACIRRRALEAQRRDPGELAAIQIQVPTATTGRVAFDHVCGNCHPHAQADVGPRLVGLGFSEEHARQQVRLGGGMMSAVPAACLPDDDLDSVILYLRTIGTVR